MTTLTKYLNLQKKQLQLEIEAIRILMQHASSKGTEAEKILTKLLRKYLPKRYSLGSGFVTENEKLSPQLDIIIYDEVLNVPIYRGNNIGVYKAASVYGCIEVTIGKLTSEKLETDIKKLGKLRGMLKNNKMKFKKISSKPDSTKRGHIVAEDTFECGPTPRTYICALSGTSYSTPKRLANAVNKLTKKYNAHMHGILVIDNKSRHPEKEWLIWTKAFKDYKTGFVTSDAFYTMMKRMNAEFLGMYVGVYPAAD